VQIRAEQATSAGLKLKPIITRGDKPPGASACVGLRRCAQFADLDKRQTMPQASQACQPPRPPDVTPKDRCVPVHVCGSCVRLRLLVACSCDAVTPTVRPTSWRLFRCLVFWWLVALSAVLVVGLGLGLTRASRAEDTVSQPVLLSSVAVKFILG